MDIAAKEKESENIRLFFFPFRNDHYKMRHQLEIDCFEEGKKNGNNIPSV
jgi:hypothetical protein